MSGMGPLFARLDVGGTIIVADLVGTDHAVRGRAKALAR